MHACIDCRQNTDAQGNEKGISKNVGITSKILRMNTKSILKDDYYKVFNNYDELFDELSGEGLFDGCDHAVERARHDIGFSDWIRNESGCTKEKCLLMC